MVLLSSETDDFLVRPRTSPSVHASPMRMSSSMPALVSHRQQIAAGREIARPQHNRGERGASASSLPRDIEERCRRYAETIGLTEALSPDYMSALRGAELNLFSALRHVDSRTVEVYGPPRPATSDAALGDSPSRPARPASSLPSVKAAVDVHGPTRPASSPGVEIINASERMPMRTAGVKAAAASAAANPTAAAASAAATTAGRSEVPPVGWQPALHKPLRVDYRRALATAAHKQKQKQTASAMRSVPGARLTSRSGILSGGGTAGVAGGSSRGASVAVAAAKRAQKLMEDGADAFDAHQRKISNQAVQVEQARRRLPHAPEAEMGFRHSLQAMFFKCAPARSPNVACSCSFCLLAAPLRSSPLLVAPLRSSALLSAPLRSSPLLLYLPTCAGVRALFAPQPVGGARRARGGPALLPAPRGDQDQSMED